MKGSILKSKTVIMDFLKGVCIGIACIVPGVSGGTLAVILKIYDKMIEAIGNITKHFFQSVKTLLPIALGAVIGVAALVFPLRLAIDYVPLPIVSLFVGFIIGGLPGLFPKVNKKPTIFGIISSILALALVVGLCFIPTSGNYDVANMNWSGYLIFFLVGIVGSFALVVPGISGSMLLLILGFWEPILDVAASLMKFENFGSNLLILFVFALGCVVGFVAISKVMTILLKKFEYVTFMAIIAFIVGSIFAIYFTLENPIPDNVMPLWGHITLSVVLGLVGLGVSLFITFYHKIFKKKENENQIEESDSEGIDE